jgi:hypothetical protein
VTVSRRERARAATRRCAEQLKLLRAYYDDAVTLPVLKTEQHRLANQIEAINARIDAHHGDYANAKAELDDTPDLLADAASIYARGDDETPPALQPSVLHEGLPKRERPDQSQ